VFDSPRPISAGRPWGSRGARLRRRGSRHARCAGRI